MGAVRLVPLDLAVGVVVGAGGLELLATEALRTASGLVASVQAVDGDRGIARAASLVTFFEAASRRAFGDAVVEAVGAAVTAREVDAALLALQGQVEVELRKSEGAKSGGGPSQATRLVEMAVGAGVEFFHTPQREAYARVPVDGHFEVHRLRGKGFRRWLNGKFYMSERKAPGSQTLQDALGVLESRAVFDGAEYEVHVRVAEHCGSLYLDLGDDTWRVVEITETGWGMVNDPPVRFRRPNSMRSLPEPVGGGSVGELRMLLNVPDDDHWRLVVAWLIAALRPGKPLPVLALHGEQGSSKTTAERMLRDLIDPNVSAGRGAPRDAHTLMIAATNGWVVSFDNLSDIPAWLSDALCRLATGGGIGVRELYTDGEEVIFEALRPVCLTGITELAERPDLLDRCLVVTLPPIPETARRPEAELWAEYGAVRPRVLGALCAAAAAALRELPQTQVDRLPRMADFALWATAAEEALDWERGAFLESYRRNRAGANDVALEASAIAPHVVAFVETGPGKEWKGTATELLKELVAAATSAITSAAGAGDPTKLREWPKSPRALSGQLRRIAPNLRASGVEVETGEEGRGNAKRRYIRLRVMGNCGASRVAGVDGDAAGGADGDDGGGGNERAQSGSTAAADSHRRRLLRWAAASDEAGRYCQDDQHAPFDYVRRDSGKNACGVCWPEELRDVA